MFYILYGDDTSRIQQKIETIQKKHKIDNVIHYDALIQSQDQVLQEMDSISIFDEIKMICLHHSMFLSSKNTTHYELDPFLKRKGEEGYILVFICESAKLDQRKKAVKALMEISTVFSCIALDEQSQRSYVLEQLKKEHLQMDADALRWFCQRVGVDAMRIDSEIYKLKTYNDVIRLEDVKALIAPEPVNDVFKMVDALFSKNAIRLLAFYRNFRKQNMEPVAIIGLLASQVRFLFQVRVCMDQSMSKEEIASFLKAHPYRVQINMKKAQNFTSDELLEQLETLASLDQEMKMGRIDKDEGFENMVLKWM